MFRTSLLTYRPVKPTNSGQQPLKPPIKPHAFQDYSMQSSKNNLFKTIQHHLLKNNHSRHATTTDVCNIVAIKTTFPKSSDRVGNMPGTYTIRTDPSIPPVQHARHKVSIECKEQIEKALQHMEDLQIITPITEPTEWVSSITYPCKPDGTLHICLAPKDLNKAIIRECYKAPTLKDISHKLAGATIFFKLGAKDGFWSVHLDTSSSYLKTFNTHKGRYRFLCMPFS